MDKERQVKILDEQADYLVREAETLDSLAEGGAAAGEVRMLPSGLKGIADRLEAIAKYVKSVANEMRSEK
jgi:hypothetical protein